MGVAGFIDLNCGVAIESVSSLEPGDVIITNHPYFSGGLSTHMPDIQLIKPYFHGDELVCYGWDFIHSADIGGGVVAVGAALVDVAGRLRLMMQLVAAEPGHTVDER